MHADAGPGGGPGRPGGTDRLPYLPGLDGLRALAVLAVVLYHAGVSWIPGGFLGVDVFFVISGFLITRLLLDEFDRTGGVDIVRFWRRRARRLLAALVAVLAGVVVWMLVGARGELAGGREVT